jgi:hypothetical protein
MLIKDLIDQLQELYKKEMKYYDILGDPEIMIDCFERMAPSTFKYKGFSKDIVIQRSNDGIYPIITAEQTWSNEHLSKGVKG